MDPTLLKSDANSEWLIKVDLQCQHGVQGVQKTGLIGA